MQPPSRSGRPPDNPPASRWAIKLYLWEPCGICIPTAQWGWLLCGRGRETFPAAGDERRTRLVSFHGRSSWVSISRSRPPTSSNWAPIAPIPPARPRAAWWSSRRFSASTSTSAPSPTNSRKEGYAAVAPALFDRQTKDFECGYTPDEIANARKFIANPDWDAMMRDTQAAINELKSAGPVGIMGFCMGGSIAFLAACRLAGLSASVCYYGGAIAKFADEQAKCPTMMHFGETDAAIPMTDVEMIKKKHPEGRDLRLPGRRPRLPLRRARQLPRGERQARLAALDGFPHQAHEEVRSRGHRITGARARVCSLSPAAEIGERTALAA